MTTATHHIQVPAPREPRFDEVLTPAALDFLAALDTAFAGRRADLLAYFGAWPRGSGAVALYGLVEDAATAEIARCQIRQWPRHGVIDRAEVLAALDEETAALAAEDPRAPAGRARDVFVRAALSGELPGFFTTDAYTRHLVRRPAVRS
ncbi:hypothetical protein [Streptomyces albireticuli]|uniref:Malate synthase C-terminal domain-containing protein n=1 Tax=Streptomyces albireticuli TaxID=1940 RepID=A0A2A2D7R0_9ACTN|nr:hypothetical protein CK936_18080 [Streptomyces albireticuli]